MQDRIKDDLYNINRLIQIVFSLDFHGRIFVFGGQAPADVPLQLVLLEHPFDVEIESGIDLCEPLGDILMYGTFGNVEYAGRIPYGRGVFYYLLRAHKRSLLGQCVEDEKPPSNGV